MNARPTKRSSWLRRSVAGAVVLVIVVVVLIALLPMILSAGYARGLARDLVQDHVNGTVAVDGARVTWSGPQQVRGLTIDDASGRRAVEASVSVPHGLVYLFFSRAAGLNVQLSGAAQSELEEDGTLSITKLFAVDRAADEPDDAPPASSTTFPPITINVDAMRLELRDPANQRSIIVPELKGTLAVRPGEAVTVDLQGDTNADGLLGSMRLRGDATGAVSAGGRFTPKGATLAVEFQAEMIPVLGMEQYTELQAATISLTSDDLTESVVLQVNTEAQIDYQPGSRLVADIALREPFAEDGVLTFAAENLAGKVLAARVPSPLIQPFLAELPIRLTRDVGPTFDAEAHFAAGETVSAQAYMLGERAELNVTARFDTADQSWMGESLSLTVREGHPELIEAYTGLTVAAPVTFFINLDSFALPPIDPATNARPRGQYAATGRIEIYSPAMFVLDAGDDDDGEGAAREPLRIESGTINFDTPALTQHLDASGELAVEGGAISFDQRVTGLVDDTGALAAMNALALGTVTISDLPRERVIAFAPEHEATLRELLGAPVNATIETSVDGAAQRATISATSGSFSLNARAVETAESLTVEHAQVRATATPALARPYLGAETDAMTLTAAAPIEIDFDPFTLPAETRRVFAMPDGPITVQVRTPGAALANVPGLAEPIEAQQVSSTITLTLGDTLRIGAQGTAMLRRAAADQAVGALNFDLAASPGDSGWGGSGAAALRDLQVAALEALLGRDAGALSDWVGASGGVTADFSLAGGVTEATIRSALAQLTGTIRARIDARRAAVTSDDLTITLARAPIESFLNQDQPDGSSAAATDGAPRVTVPADVPVAIRVNRFELPRQSGGEGGFDLGALSTDLELRAQPLIIRQDGAGQSESSLRDLRIMATSSGLAGGVEFSLTGKAGGRAESGTPTEGDVRVTGTLQDLVAADGSIAPGGAQADLDATVELAPTVVADAMLGMSGYLLAAVGPQMTATVQAANFSRDSGSLNLDVVTTNGYLRGQGTASEGLLRFVEGSPIQAQLEINPLLREKLLSRLHPLLKDVIVTQEPLRATVSGATLPLDGDVSRLNATISLELGEVEFDRESPLFSLLALAQSGTPTLAGAIEPVRATVTDGIVRYDRFNVTVGEVPMPYEGQVNLNTRSVLLRTTLPLGAIASRFKPNVGGEVDSIAVPVVTRGSFGALKSEIAPDFDLARAILESTLKNQVDDKLPIPVGNILDLIGGKDKKDSEVKDEE